MGNAIIQNCWDLFLGLILIECWSVSVLASQYPGKMPQFKANNQNTITQNANAWNVTRQNANAEMPMNIITMDSMPLTKTPLGQNATGQNANFHFWRGICSANID